MPPKGGGGGDKSQQFFDGIKTQKQDAIRWCLNYGGISVATRSDEGYTGLHMAALLGKPRSLETILDHLRRAHLSRGGGDIRGPPGPRKKRCDELEDKDEEAGMTAFMHACAKGSMECVRLLHECGADWKAKSDAGLTALDYAKKQKYENIVAWFARGGQDQEEEEEEDSNIPEIEGESGAERRKRIKALKAGGEKFAAMSKKDGGDDKGGDDDDTEEDDIGPGPAPQWEEIKECRAKGQADLVCVKLGSEKAVDPSLWYCRQVNNLKLRMPPGVLKELPQELSYLKSLTTLIVSNNALTKLPDALINLAHLKNLEFTDNKVKEFPEDMKDLEHLEVIDACRNALESIEPLKGIVDLVTLKLDQNKLKSIDHLSFRKLTRLNTLSASHNEISSLSSKVSQLKALTSLNLSNNSLKELPVEMGDLKEKVLLHLNLDDNPLKDSKAKKILEKGRAPIKELLAHLRKEAESGKGKKKKAKDSEDEGEEGEEEEEEEEELEEEEPVMVEPVAAAPAPAAGGSGGGGGGGGKNKKKGKGKGGGGGGGMSDAQKEAARIEAMRKLGMPVPAAAAKKGEKKEEKTEEKQEAAEPAAAPDFDAGSEADEDDLAQYMQEGGSDMEESDDEDDLDDFLADKPTKSESKEERDKRIAKELEARKKGKAELDKEREKKKKEHEEWLASMTEEMRTMYFADQERKRRAAEEEARAEEEEKERRRQEEMRRKAAAAGAAGAVVEDTSAISAAAAKRAADKMESKWSYVGDKLEKEVVERKGPRKAMKEIQLRLPSRKIGLIIGKAGVNIKIIEGKSGAKVKIFKPQEGAIDASPETLITIKGTPEQVDKCCDTINMVFSQWKAQRQASKK